MSEKTIFQKIVDREIPAPLVYEDDLVAAFNDLNPQAPIHVLIVPKKVIQRVGEAVAEDQATLGALLLAAGKIADKLGIKDRNAYLQTGDIVTLGIKGLGEQRQKVISFKG